MRTYKPSGTWVDLAWCIDLEGNVLLIESLDDALCISRLKTA